MFVLLGISLLLAAWLGFNSLAAMGTALLWRVAGRLTLHWTALTRARVIFWLRILPAFLGAALVVILIAPAYLELEPRTTNETVGLKLGVIAFASAMAIALAIIRSIAVWRATARLTANWLAHARPVSFPQSGVPAYRIDHRFPVIAIIGVWRPRLFLGGKVFDSLTVDEIAAAIEHEIGHLATRDNLKRTLLRVCTDLMLLVPYGRALNEGWTAASEAAADEYAARRGPAVALDLASALVKISRMIPTGTRPAMPAGSFLVGGQDTFGVNARVRRLLEIASGESPADLYEPLIANLAVWLVLASLFSLVAFTISNPQVLTTVHSSIEQVVSFLS